MTLTAANGAGLIGGGALYSNSTLRLDNVTINNATAATGGAIYQDGGTANFNSIVLGNSLYLVNTGNVTLGGITTNSSISVSANTTTSCIS
ncbi:MAG: hypothetical protein ACK55Z_32560, partial [bacterium]